ncbi:hypothetical protein pb186bvf_002059 [Paramecium bursaria]
MSDQILYADDSQYINDITQKLAKIRQTLGIDIYDQEIFQTPPSEPSNMEHNTFGKNNNPTKVSDSKASLLEPNQQSISKQELYTSNRSIRQSLKGEEPSQLPQQISFLQNKLEELKQIYPVQGQDQATFLERENVYLKIELELKTKQERFLRTQLQNIQEENNIRIQHLSQSLEDFKLQHENFIQSTELTGDVKQYIIGLESDLFLTKNELNLFTQRLAKEQGEKELLINQTHQQHVRAREEFQKLYEKAFQELQFMCQALSSELLNETVEKKCKRVQSQTNFSKLYQDMIDEKFILENKVDELENKLEQYQNKIQYAPSIKIVYEKRLSNMKQGLLHWKTRTQQIEQIVLQWLSKLREENNQLKNSLVKKQNKMFQVFENLMREVYSVFQNDKNTLLEQIRILQEQKVQDAHKIICLRAQKKKK